MHYDCAQMNLRHISIIILLGFIGLLVWGNFFLDEPEVTNESPSTHIATSVVAPVTYTAPTTTPNPKPVVNQKKKGFDCIGPDGKSLITDDEATCVAFNQAWQKPVEQPTATTNLNNKQFIRPQYIPYVPETAYHEPVPYVAPILPPSTYTVPTMVPYPTITVPKIDNTKKCKTYYQGTVVQETRCDY